MKRRRRLLVGIVAHTDISALHGTLDAVEAARRADDRVVLVPDGPDQTMATALAADPRLASLPQLVCDRPRGNSVAFNRLARYMAPDDGALIFLENGARPAPDTLDRLARALDRPGVGLAGPSTNDAWNEQRAVADESDHLGDPSDAAARLMVFYGDECRSLAPLHSLAEFCFAVSREALAAVGAADEGFGLGPCWEMEYTARAARAGFEAVWVCAAYVQRAPTTRRRLLQERDRFTAAKERYQDRLCGLRLDGTRSHYVDHCAGDACPYFAPLGRILVHLPLGRTSDFIQPPALAQPEAIAQQVGTPPCATPLVVRPPSGTPLTLPSRRGTPRTSPAPPRAALPARPGRRRRTGTMPFVSCVMVTADRPDWARQAIAYFHRQDHPAVARELIVVDDGEIDLQHELRDVLDHPAITSLRLPARVSIGAKRNLGAARAAGDVLVQWDDDDWYGPERISRQVAPIIAGTADITGLRDAIWFDLKGWLFRRPTQTHHRRLFWGEDVHGGTLVFHRWLWDGGLRYPDSSLAEDATFVSQAVRRGARLARLQADGVYLYVRHASNTWRLNHQHERTGWHAVPEPEELSARGDDHRFYLARSEVARPVSIGSPAPSASPAAGLAGWRPTVSCIMPTADRLSFVPSAVEGFLAQRYDNAELLVVDDGDESTEHLVPNHPRIRYLRLDHRYLLGDKRNLAVEAALGEVIVHFDDDDWSHPDRLTVQLAALSSGTAELCGLSTMLWWDPRRRAAWRYVCPPLHRPWVAGNTLAYLRDAWRRTPFPRQATGEDTAFVWGDRQRRVLQLEDERLVIGTLHPHNTSPKHTGSTAWTRVDPSEVLRVMDEAGSSRTPERSG